jgi:hypothetical protein
MHVVQWVEQVFNYLLNILFIQETLVPLKKNGMMLEQKLQLLPPLPKNENTFIGVLYLKLFKQLHII